MLLIENSYYAVVCGEYFDTGLFNCIDHSDNCKGAVVKKGVDIGFLCAVLDVDCKE